MESWPIDPPPSPLGKQFLISFVFILSYIISVENKGSSPHTNFAVILLSSSVPAKLESELGIIPINPAIHPPTIWTSIIELELDSEKKANVA